MTTEAQIAEAEEESREDYDTSDKAAVNKQRKRAAARHRGQLEVLAHVMSSPGGRSWMFDTLLMCNIFGEPFEPGAQDVTNYRLGMANVGRKLLADIQACASQEYLLMLKENN